MTEKLATDSGAERAARRNHARCMLWSKGQSNLSGQDQINELAAIIREETGTQWIPVGERLPEIIAWWGPKNMYGGSKVVLVYTSQGKQETATRYESGTWDTTGGEMLGDVTHWMSLPAAPDEGGKR